MTRFSGRLRPPLLLAAVLISASASAQVSYRYADWADGPVKFLMTKVEMKQWKTIHSDADAQAFIDLFWARRDPTPDTPRNEFRDEFDARVKIADDQFSNGRDRGGSRGQRRGRRRKRGGGARVPDAEGDRSMTSELAIAAFAAASASHVVAMPRSRRFALFARSFRRTGSAAAAVSRHRE